MVGRARPAAGDGWASHKGSRAHRRSRSAQPWPPMSEPSRNVPLRRGGTAGGAGPSEATAAERAAPRC
eukprot:8855628-Lingulodinium_polyedra.AAC.1